VIVWLASYPRSGNTLLRTLLHETMGCGSYSDEADEEVRRSIDLQDPVTRAFGRRELPAPWEAFYKEASASPEPRFVKTHRPPRDGQDALYVVREGRHALVSYTEFHRRFHGARARSLVELVLGLDVYGDWSAHYRAWTRRPVGRTLVLRYEEVVDAPEALLRRIADFIGRAEAPLSWKNPFDEMKQHNPGFFRSARLKWDGDPSWSDFVDSIFFELHGELMEELGYASSMERTAARERLTSGERVLAALARSLGDECRKLEGICVERQVVIDELARSRAQPTGLIQKLFAR
jgi:hypothetical protein